jgi:precorrin-6B methylase 2
MWKGSLHVLGGGIFQSGSYIARLFRRMLRLVPKDMKVDRILLLGLGAGSCLKEIFRKYPKAHVVALEYDSTMIELCKSWHLPHVPRDQVEIIQGDIRDTLEKLSGKFDLIFVDVFSGAHVSPLVVQPSVLKHLHRLLAWRGAILVNWFKEDKHLSPSFEELFTWHRSKRVIGENVVGLYRRSGMGRPGEMPLKEYQERAQSPQIQASKIQGKKNKELIIDQGGVGIRSHWGPLVIDAIGGRISPALTPLQDRWRLVLWQPHGPVVHPWRRIPRVFGTSFLKGVVELQDGYFQRWNSQARRQRSVFLATEELQIERVDLATFEKAFHQASKLDGMTRMMFVTLLRYHHTHHPSHLFLHVVRHQRTGIAVAGLATVDTPDVSLSSHLIAFVHKTQHSSCAGIGLIDDWYTRCLSSGMRFLNLGLLRRPGKDPKSWQGYTDFKRQLSPYEIELPERVWTLVRPSKRS